MVKKIAFEDVPPQKPTEESKSTHSAFDSALVIIGIVALTILLVVATTGVREKWDRQEQIGKELCQNHSFIYNRIDSLHKTIVCGTNITYNAEHYNISPETLEVVITPDWDYYLNTTKKGATK